MTRRPPPTLRRTTWTFRQNLTRVIWGSLARPFWILVPLLRPSLIRLFGGKVGRGCRIARTASIYIPWHVQLGDNVQIGPRAIIYSLGMITLGDGVILDERAHLCAGTHDMDDPEFELIRMPITIGDESFIGLDVYVAPGVTLGRNCRVWPRASVYGDFPDDTTLRGNPARPFKPEST